MNAIDNLKRLLSVPAGYRLFRRFVGGKDVLRIYLDEYVKPVAGEKVLDIGCGPADVLDYLPKVDYTGVDISPEYIASAQKRLGDRARFICSDVASFVLEKEQGTFDLVLATGVVHHLENSEAAGLFELARKALRPGGRMVTFDGCYVPGQSRMARWVLAQDRGKFVREQREYERLASGFFTRIESALRHDLLRIPYTHLIMRCST